MWGQKLPIGPGQADRAQPATIPKCSLEEGSKVISTPAAVLLSTWAQLCHWGALEPALAGHCSFLAPSCLQRMKCKQWHRLACLPCWVCAGLLELGLWITWSILTSTLWSL